MYQSAVQQMEQEWLQAGMTQEELERSKRVADLIDTLASHEDAIQKGINQLNMGQHKTYDAETLREMFAQIKFEGRRRLAEYQKQENA